VLAGTVAAGVAALAIASGNSAAPMDAARVPSQPGTQAVWPAELEAAGDKALKRFTDTAHLAAVPVGPGEVAEPVRVVLSSSEVVTSLGESGIPEVALAAYKQAARRLASQDPTCGLRWTLLAAIGRVESDHGRFGGAQLRADGYGTLPIRGIPLDGRPNVALIRDTDGGQLDGDTTYDRAVGPMQFIPSTWASVGVDANGDGSSDPNNIFDAALGAGGYLCVGDTDLRDSGQLTGAILRYNNADEYVRVVLNLAGLYETGRVPTVTGLAPPADVFTFGGPGSASAEQPAGPRRSAAPGPGSTAGSSAASESVSPDTPTRSEPPQTEPTSTAPATSEPTSTAPATSEPTSTAPATTQPTTTEPTSTEPSTTEPTSTEPSTTVPSTSEPTTTAPTLTDPSTTEPTTTDTSTTDLSTTDPSESEQTTAAVGWAPTMRELVLTVLNEEDRAGQAVVTPQPK
jgi:membrane-bound lytic murein transglycosylase B